MHHLEINIKKDISNFVNIRSLISKACAITFEPHQIIS